MAKTKEQSYLVLGGGTVKRLHVDRQIITVQTSKGPFKAHRVDVLGPSQFVQANEKRGIKPLKCGARVWIETRAIVTVYRETPK
jgi:hypothetical protein